MSLHGCNVGGIDRAIYNNVFAEIGIGNGLAGLSLGLTYVGGIHRAISGYVANQHRHRHANVSRIRAIIYSLHGYHDPLCVRYSAKVDGNRIRPASGAAANHSRASADRRAGERHGVREGKHNLVVIAHSAAAAFDTGITRERQGDIVGCGAVDLP